MRLGVRSIEAARMAPVPGNASELPIGVRRALVAVPLTAPEHGDQPPPPNARTERRLHADGNRRRTAVRYASHQSSSSSLHVGVYWGDLERIADLGVLPGQVG